MSVEEVFRRYAKTQSNKIVLSEFILILKKLKMVVVEEKVAVALFAYLDTNMNGALSQEEFKNWISSPIKYDLLMGKRRDRLLMAYDLFCKYNTGDNSGLTYNDFEKMLVDLGIAHTEYDFDKLDNNADGLISFYELCQWLKWLS